VISLAHDLGPTLASRVLPAFCCCYYCCRCCRFLLLPLLLLLRCRSNE